MESKTKNKQTRQQIESMAVRAFNGMGLAGGDGAISELKEGWFNVAYQVRLADGREVILKIAPPKGAEVMSYEKSIMDTEVSSMRLVRQNSRIPVPEIYYFDNARDLCDADYFFMEKLTGHNLEHVSASLAPEVRAQVEFQVGEIIREINGFTGTYFGYPGNPDLRASTWKEAYLKMVDSVLADGRQKNAVYGFSEEEIHALIGKHVSSLEAIQTPCLVHWDAWNPNIFIQDGQVTGLLDFERAFWGDPLMEAQFRPFFGDIPTNHMRGYGKTEYSFEEEQRCHLYTLHLGLVMNTECYFRHYDTDEIYNMSLGIITPAMEWLKAN